MENLDKIEFKNEPSYEENSFMIKAEEINIKSENVDIQEAANYLEDSLLLEPNNLVAPDVFSCSKCLYVTNRKHNLQVHSLTHKSLDEVVTYKCTVCPYITKHKAHINLHLKTHQNRSEVSTHKCPLCTYQSILKTNLKRHLLSHKNVEADSGKILDQELLRLYLEVHSTKLEKVVTHKCEICGYKTNEKSKLKRHRLTHEPKEDVEQVKCAMCPFQTKFKSNITRHIQKQHKSNEPLNKCDLCDFKSIRKASLSVHMTLHTDGKSVKKCSVCAYQTINQIYFKNHMKKHLKKDKTKTHNCNNYETRFRTNLKLKTKLCESEKVMKTA